MGRGVILTSRWEREWFEAAKVSRVLRGLNIFNKKSTRESLRDFNFDYGVLSVGPKSIVGHFCPGRLKKLERMLGRWEHA